MNDFENFIEMFKKKEKEMFEQYIQNQNLDSALYNITKEGIISLCKLQTKFLIMRNCLCVVQSDKEVLKKQNKQTIDFLEQTNDFYTDVCETLEKITDKICKIIM